MNISLHCIFKTFLFSCLFSYSAFSQLVSFDVFDVCRKGTLEEIKEIYKKNNELINCTNEQGYSPLTLACYNGNIAVASFLAERVSDIDGNSKYGTPLMAAVYKGNDHLVSVLLKYNANPNKQDLQGETAMHYAVLFKKYDIIKLLKEAKADFTIKNNVEKSALDFAISYKDEKLNELLNVK